MKPLKYVLFALLLTLPFIAKAMLSDHHHTGHMFNYADLYKPPMPLAAEQQRKPAGGNCNGTQCGCHVKWCWAFQYSNSKSGYPWCYTQTLGAKRGQGSWAECKEHTDCSWEMTCGASNNQFFFGDNADHWITVPENELVTDSASNEEKQIAIIKMIAQKDLKVARDKFDYALKLLEQKYKDLLKEQSEAAKKERERVKKIIHDMCELAGIRVPEDYR